MTIFFDAKIQRCKGAKSQGFSYIFFASLLLCAFASISCAQDTPTQAIERIKKQTPVTKPQLPKLPADYNKFVIVISGIGGEEIYETNFRVWTSLLHEQLITKLGFAEEQTTVFAEKPEDKEQIARADNIKQAFASLRTKLKPDNQLFIFFIGHGSFDGKVAKFNLSGPDLSVDDYSKMIGELPTQNIVILNMSSASGEFLKPLASKGRIIITATRSGNEQNAVKFPQYLIDALKNPDADADKNGRVSVYEAFDYATKSTKNLYEQAGKLLTEHSALEDSNNGALAKSTYFDSLPQQQAGGDKELAKLFSERMRLEAEIQQLKTRKDKMSESDYDTALESLLIELAKVDRTIRKRHEAN